MTTDHDKVHRWLTQAELDGMLAESFRRGAMRMQQAIVRRLQDLSTYPWPAEQKRIVENCAVVALIEKLPEEPKDT